MVCWLMPVTLALRRLRQEAQGHLKLRETLPQKNQTRTPPELEGKQQKEC